MLLSLPTAVRLPALALTLFLGIPACLWLLPEAAVAAPARAQSVQIKNFAFVPAVLVVAPGTTVTWTNVDEDPHTVTANNRSFHSTALDTDDKYSFTFTTPGDFAYFCSLHPHMVGKIMVRG
jgi:plastocyanin